MGKAIEVPVTPEVLNWAIAESGYTVPEFADAAGVELDDLHAWLKGEARPGLTAARSLAKTLHRPVAALLLPRPPGGVRPEVQFRHMPGAETRELTPDERRYLRKAARLQKMIGWIADEMHEARPTLPTAIADDQPDETANALRNKLGVSVTEQLEWASASSAFDAWRVAVEELGVVVFLFQLGKDNCRGFSLWHERAPVIAINTAWNEEARTFTLFHELGHLVTRTNSACTATPPETVRGPWDPTERWCEKFAAAVLLPETAIRKLAGYRMEAVAHAIDVTDVKWIATRVRVSLRAVTLRLIGLGLADWDLYRQLPATTDDKRGGGGGKGRDRQERQEDQLGGRAIQLFRRAIDNDVLSQSEALTYLDVPVTSLESLGARPA